MLRLRYLVLLVLATLALGVVAGCASLGIGQPTATPTPFNRYTAESVTRAFSTAGLPVQNVERDLVVGRGAPSEFSDRYIFEITRIAPLGGQFIIFQTAEELQAWLNYIETLRADSSTRRDVVYVYTNSNVLLQLNANLTQTEAMAFQQALQSMS